VRSIFGLAMVSILWSAPTFAQSSDQQTYPVGSGVTSPVLIREVKPQYTADAMRRKVQGIVEVSAVVLTDGTVGEVRVRKSLDPDLDQEAIKAAKQWQFKPGTKDGEPVNVQITIELSFTLRNGPPPPVYRVGDGVSAPVVTRRVEPQYTDEARRARISGSVGLEAVVETDGSVSDVRVTKSLDEGLDRESIKALRQWQFKPGQKDGAAVRVRVEIEMTFNVK
jgi:TonB family protein